MTERRRHGSEPEVRAAVEALARPTGAIPASAWSPLGAADAPGLYSWWVDAGGAEQLASGLACRLSSGLIYAGQTGATKWPSGWTGKMTLTKRIGGNHLRGTTRGSTFRWTLASILREQLDLRVEGPRRIASEDEARLTAWMREHLAVAVFTYSDRDRLGDIERRVLQLLDPPLNLEGMPMSDVRRALKERRGSVR